MFNESRREMRVQAAKEAHEHDLVLLEYAIEKDKAGEAEEKAKREEEKRVRVARLCCVFFGGFSEVHIALSCIAMICSARYSRGEKPDYLLLYGRNLICVVRCSCFCFTFWMCWMTVRVEIEERHIHTRYRNAQRRILRSATLVKKKRKKSARVQKAKYSSRSTVPVECW